MSQVKLASHATQHITREVVPEERTPKRGQPPADLAISDVQVDAKASQVHFKVTGLPHPKNILRAHLRMDLVDGTGKPVAQRVLSYDQYTGGQRDQDHFAISMLDLPLPKNGSKPLTLRVTVAGIYERKSDKQLDGFTYKTETQLP